MALKFNNTNIASSYTLKHNNTALSAVKFGSTQVWSSQTPIFDPSLADPYCTALTGGYSVSVADLVDEYTFATISGQMIQAAANGGAGPNRAYMVISTVNAIDLTPYSKFHITGCMNAGSGRENAIGWSKTRGERGGQRTEGFGSVSGYYPNLTVTHETITMDVSGLSGAHYLNLYMYTTGGGVVGVTRMVKGILQ